MSSPNCRPVLHETVIKPALWQVFEPGTAHDRGVSVPVLLQRLQEHAGARVLGGQVTRRRPRLVGGLLEVPVELDHDRRLQPQPLAVLNKERALR